MNFYSPQKSSENHRFSDDFLMISGGIKLILLNSLHIKCEIWRRSLSGRPKTNEQSSISAGITF